MERENGQHPIEDERLWVAAEPGSKCRSCGKPATWFYLRGGSDWCDPCKAVEQVLPNPITLIYEGAEVVGDAE